MVSLTQMALKLEEGLREEITAALEKWEGYPLFPENSSRSTFDLTVTADTADFKPSYREGNNAVWTIQGLLTQIGSTVEGVSGASRTAGVDCRLDFVVRCIPGTDDNSAKEVVPFFRSVLDGYFSENAQGSMEDADGNTWAFGVNYQTAQSGIREIIPGLGDTFSFTIVMNWYFAEGGINSQRIALYIGGERVWFTRIGINRNSSDTKAVPSTSAGVAVRNYTESNQITIGFDAPAFSSIVGIISPYLLQGTVSDLAVVLYIDQTKQAYTMHIANAALNGDTILTASVSVTLVQTEVVTDGNV